MSRQDNETCFICNKECGYDDNKAYLDYHNPICSKCKTEILKRFCGLLGLKTYSTDQHGIEIDWGDAKRITDEAVYKPIMRCTYITNDMELAKIDAYIE